MTPVVVEGAASLLATTPQGDPHYDPNGWNRPLMDFLARYRVGRLLSLSHNALIYLVEREGLEPSTPAL